MRQRSTYLVGIVLTLIVGTFFNWWLCCGNPNAAAAATMEKENTALRNPLVFSDPEASFDYRTNQNFNFLVSDYLIMRPLSDSIAMGVDQVAAYLEANPGKVISITGYFGEDEENRSPFPNLGIARATHIKNYFIARGVPASQIDYEGKPSSNLLKKDSVYYGPVGFSFSGDLPEASGVDSLGKQIRDNPLVVYFDYGESDIELTQEQREKVADISRYIHLDTTATFHIIGHTDNSSSAKFNLELGLKRAAFVRDYFVTHGIPADRITIASEGETQPIADNNTRAGRAKNRRTVITISITE
ncbi:OmpA family protein [Robertkochia aurantiaca]|uniref:OmpA family protein n=1 Tax=Robertkochia aurantiaca TaxID=2873700 RepID=UPI001CCD920B|nr:OmpA family protein [Robertkochia sp. 3YJGBD-33]